MRFKGYGMVYVVKCMLDLTVLAVSNVQIRLLLKVVIPIFFLIKAYENLTFIYIYGLP